MARCFTVEDALRLNDITARHPIHLSKDGQWVAYSVQTHLRRRSGGKEFLPTKAPVSVEGNEVAVTNVETGETWNLTPGWGTSWAPRWSPDGSQLAFFSDCNGVAQLWVWEKESRQSRFVCDAAISALFEFEIPLWMPDGSRIVLKLRPEGEPSPAKVQEDKAPDEHPPSTAESPTVQVWISFGNEKTKDESDQKDSSPPTWSDRYLGDVAVVTVATGFLQRLARRYRPIRLNMSPDGTAVALMNFAAVETPKAQQNLFDLVVVPLNGTQPRVLVHRLRQNYGIGLSWSPDSKQIAYTTDGPLADKKLYVVSVADGQQRTLASDSDIQFGHIYERPLWSPDGKWLFCLGANRLWQVSARDGEYQELGADLSRRILGIVHANDGYTVWSSDNGNPSITVQTFSTKSKQEGFFRIRLSDGSVQPLIEEDRWYGGMGGLARFTLDVSEETGNIVHVVEDATHPPDIWLAKSSFRERKQVTQLNPNLTDVAFGETRLIRWKQKDGEDGEGKLILPADYQTGKQYPMVVWVYSGKAIGHALNWFGWPDMQILASAGYAVWLPSLPKANPPMQALPDLLMPSIDRLIELGFADSERIGLFGHSYGGYNVLCLIVQTDRFKAAVSASPFGNLVSLYGNINEKGENTFLSYLEGGQGGMGGTLWEKRECYIENSPVFFLARVSTPLLLIQGELDYASFSQTDEIFSGLRRLSKKVVYARYFGEEHSPGEWRKANVIDFWARLLAWFDEHLMPRMP